MHTGHANDMTTWETIGCTFGHETHATKTVHVDLGRPHGYRDLPVVPVRFHREFDFEIWDYPQYMGLDAYCPARDAVSETIDTLGIWEPAETILMMSACSAYPNYSFMDFGSQLGWFARLANECGMYAYCIDADADNVEMTRRNVTAGGVLQSRVDATRASFVAGNADPAIVKIDIEGAEIHAIQALTRQLDDHTIKHLLIEISPVFADYYGTLVCDLLHRGYTAYVVPEKARPPWVLEQPQDDLAPHWLASPDVYSDDLWEHVNSWHQKNVWFCAPDARWA